MRTRTLITLLLAAVLLPGCAEQRLPPGTIELEVWSGWTGDEGKAFQALCDRFTRENPSIRIHNIGGVTDSGKILRAITAGVPPDLFTVWDASDLGPLSTYGAIRTLNADFDAAGLKTADFVPGALSLCRDRGRLIAMPLLMDTNALLWNRAAFREAGLDPNRPPQTLDELKDDAKKLTIRDASGEITRLGLQPPGETLLLCLICGGGFIDPQTGAVTANNPGNVEGFQYYADLENVQGGHEKVDAFGSGYGAGQGPNQPFIAGKVAMCISGEWMPSWCEKYAPNLDYGVAPVPYDAKRPDMRGTTSIAPNLLAIPSEARHPAAAWKFLSWLQRPDVQTQFAEALNNVPNIKAALRDPHLTTGSPRRENFGRYCRIAQNPNARGFPVTPVGQLYQDELGHAIDAVMFGEKSPKQALDDVQAKVSKELANVHAE